jgi:hypothetical protein
VPHAADPRASFEDADIVVASAVQHDRSSDSAEAASNDGNRS